MLYAEIPALLEEAFQKGGEQEGRWAYTETCVLISDQGKTTETIVMRYDPSKPYAEQYTPISIRGAAPTEKDRREYRKRGDQEAIERQKLMESGRTADDISSEMVVGNTKGKPDWVHTTVMEESEQSITYKIPIKNTRWFSSSVEKIGYSIRVNKQHRTLENLRFRLLKPFRAKLILKVKSMEATLEYAKVVDDYPPEISRVELHISASVPFTETFEIRQLITRSDFKHVKPYDERCSVKMGPLRSLGF